MKRGYLKRLLLALSILVFVLCAISLSVLPTAALEYESSGGGLPKCTLADKVQLVSFSHQGRTPNPDGVVFTNSIQDFKLVFKNLCPSGTANLTVSWKIYKDNQIFSSGTESVSPGTTITKTNSWTTIGSSGTHKFYPELVTGTERDTTNSDIVIQIMEQKELTYVLAKNYGAQFADNVQGTSSCAKLGQEDASKYGNNSGVYFNADCFYATDRGTAKPEVFKNLTLKNGWKIWAVNFNEILGSSTWLKNTAPSRGSVNPYTQITIWDDPGKQITVNMRMYIYGPAGSSPF